MRDPGFAGFGFAIIMLVAWGCIGILFSRRQANVGNVLVLLLAPFVYLFVQPMIHGGAPRELQEVSGELVIAVIGSIIGGAILLVAAGRRRNDDD